MSPELRAEELRRYCDLGVFDFSTTADLEPHTRIIGQSRGTQAIEFGINVESPGYNIYVLGEAGTGRTTAIERFLQERADAQAIPPDWAYVYNFREPHKPVALSIPAGLGCAFRDNLSRLVADLLDAVPREFESDVFREAAQELEQSAIDAREKELAALQAAAVQHGTVVQFTPEGAQILPVKDGQPLSPQSFTRLPEPEQETMRSNIQVIQHEFDETLRRLREQEIILRADMQQLVERIAQGVVDSRIQPLLTQYEDHPEMVNHLNQVQTDLVQNIHLFREPAEEEQTWERSPAADRFRRYQVNVIVDRRPTEGAPVIVANDPQVPRLLGRVEHEIAYPAGTLTDFTLIRGGALHEANGGYLVLRVRDLAAEPGAWEALKRALVGGNVTPDDPATRGGAPTRSLDPQPVPLDVKVILIGPAATYFALYTADEDFRTLFKVMADFDEEMERTPDNEREYAHFVATLCHEEGLRHLDRSAVGLVVEFGSRLAGTQEKLSTRFGEIADMVREANYWARVEGQELVGVKAVRQAILRREFRQNRLETRVRENISRQRLLIATESAVVGQINGLTVSSVGEYAFGSPVRVTARTFVGRDGVVQIDREVALAGPIHNKGVMTLSGYLGGQYADGFPLSLSAQITFEQNYGGVEGDSASSTELYALLSSLSGYPTRQAVAVTGSVNQLGDIQAIGGVTLKVEGWFEVCKRNGLTGEQGVLIPRSNASDLMLRDDLLAVVRAGQFHVWSVGTVDEGIEILTGKTAGDVHAAVKARLAALAEINRRYLAPR